MGSFIKIYDVSNRRTLIVNIGCIAYIDTLDRQVVFNYVADIDKGTITTDEESLKRLMQRVGC